MNGVIGVLIDTVGIQRFIFSSHKLKENVGASFLVQQIFDDILKTAIQEGLNIPSTSLSYFSSNGQCPTDITFVGKNRVEVGYVGGGNALLFFQNQQDVSAFIQAFTKLLLTKIPGVRVAFGINSQFNVNEFQQSMEQLNQSLKENRMSITPNVTLPKYGFTAECSRTGESSEILAKEDDEVTFISKIAKVKENAAALATKKLSEELSDVLGDKYCFTNEITELSLEPGKMDDQEYNDAAFNQNADDDLNYIAVVHVDGNNMGRRFQQCLTLTELCQLSKDVEGAVKSAFKSMIKELINVLETEQFQTKTITMNGKTKSVLPIRPIILGGDDITFVCDGRLGVWLAEKFIESFIQQTVSDGQPLSASGGVAIVKTKYPFFRAYKLAESLTKNAKREAKKKEGSSYLDFFVSTTGWVNERFDSTQGFNSLTKLHFGPYRVDGDPTTEPHHVTNLKKIIKEFKEKWPRNKVYKLQELIEESISEKEVARVFLEELKARNLQLPEVPNKLYHQRAWQDGKTPYHDAITLMKFYLEELL